MKKGVPTTFCLAVSASLQAVLYMSIVCFSSSFSLLISASMSSCNVFNINRKQEIYKSNDCPLLIFHQLPLLFVQDKITMLCEEEELLMLSLETIEKSCIEFTLVIELVPKRTDPKLCSELVEIR